MTDRRLLAPDFARGTMLLLIVLSNSALFLYGRAPAGSGVHPYPAADSAADTVTQFLMIALLDVRVYPLFTFLVGYGIVLSFTAHADRAGSDAAARLIQRRNRWLFVFGMLHAVLLLGSEVLAAYGLIGLVLCALFLRGSDRRLGIAAGIGAGLLAAVFVLAVAALIAITLLSPAGPAPETMDTGSLNGSDQDSYLASAVVRLFSWVALLFINSFGVVLPTALLIGMWAARRRVLQEPGEHLPLLRRTAVVGVLLGLAGALPAALAHVGLFVPPPAGGLSEGVLFAMTWTSGLAGGLGYVAVFALVAHWVAGRDRAPVAVSSVAALGKRSLSGYLTHSIVMAPLLSAWGLGLGGVFGSAAMALFALGLWLATVVAAVLMERRGARGPFEVLLRRLSTRPTRRTARAG
jgi:uncharacterized membrane protein YeiB